MHPDKGGSPESFHLLRHAFEVLSCYPSRLTYDQTHKANVPQKKQPGHNTSATAKTVLRTHVAKQSHSARRGLTQRRRKHIANNSGKYQCAGREPYTQHNSIARLRLPMRQLCAILQEMKPEVRQASIQTLSPNVKVALTIFMKSCKSSPVNQAQGNSHHIDENTASRIERSSQSDYQPRPLLKAALTCSSGHQPLYKAHMHIKALRFYTHGHHKFDVARDRQMTLVRLRQALTAASKMNPSLWEDVRAAYQICLEVLKSHNTSESEMGLSSYVYMRAGHMLVQNCTIISPVIPLIEALELHCRLLRARRTSWQALRAEWVELMQSSKQPLARRKTLSDAEAIADEARSAALKLHFSRSRKRLAKAMELDEKRVSKKCTTMVKKLLNEQQKLSRARNQAKIGFEQQRKDRFKLHQRWRKRSDLTMDEIMRGSPLWKC